MDWSTRYSDIDACMWIGQPGSTGINAVVDLLKGEDKNGNKISPSAHLADTWAYNLNSAPSTINDGNYTYQNTDLLNSKIKANIDFFNKYMVSTIGTYHSSDKWKYSEEVAFPFGYGLSYADFSYSNYHVSEDETGYEVLVDVTNTSDIPAKEVVQVYLSKPYTDYDRENGIEKSAVELVGYAKTKELKKNEKETVSIHVDKDSFKTFDAENKGRKR